MLEVGNSAIVDYLYGTKTAIFGAKSYHALDNIYPVLEP